MNLRTIAFAVTILCLLFCFSVGDYGRADEKLELFYRQILTADFTSACRSIDEAVLLWPTNSRYHTWSAYCYSQTLPPQCPRCFQGMSSAMIEVSQKSAQRAIDEYQDALHLNSRDAVAYHNLAWLEHLLGNDAGAERDFQKATILDPNNAVFHLSYGMLLEELGKQDDARGQYEFAIILSPSALDSQFFVRYRVRSPELAKALVRDCIVTLERQLRSHDDPIVEARLGKLYQNAGQKELSSRMLHDAADQLPNLPLVWLNLGENYQAAGDHEEAMHCYEKANVVDPSLAGPYLRMGELLLRQGRKADAATNFERAVQTWGRVKPVTAAHNNRLYNGPRQLIDDLLPTTLLWYVSPCEASEAYAGMAKLYPGKPELVRRSRTCEELPSPHLCYQSR